MSQVPAQMMSGLSLDKGWTVRELIPKQGSATGSMFSFGYIVEHETGRKGFLKALDFSRAFRSPNVIDAIKSLGDAYSHERRVLEACRSFKMSRVVHAIADGQVLVDPQSPIGTVPYFIFDLADGDVRKALGAFQSVDNAWVLRTLHDIAVGLFQLHSNKMAHQDLKPSNVLTFADYGSRVADLGCASVQSDGGPRDGLDFAGDPAYAPPEHLYGYLMPEWKDRRLGGDGYMFANMVVFMFCKTALSHLMMSRLESAHRPAAWGGAHGGTFDEVLPYLNNAFDEAVLVFETDCNGPFAADLVRVVRELGNPDPRKRGSPINRQLNAHPCSMERYVSEFNLMASKAEVGLHSGTK